MLSMAEYNWKVAKNGRQPPLYSQKSPQDTRKSPHTASFYVDTTRHGGHLDEIAEQMLPIEEGTPIDIGSTV
jgi:hypothetical protein